MLSDAEAGELCRLLDVFSPEELDARERLTEALPQLLGFAAFRRLSAVYAQASDPEEMRELFQARRSSRSTEPRASLAVHRAGRATGGVG